MTVASLLYLLDPADELTEETTGDVSSERPVTCQVVKQFTAVQGLQNLAIEHSLGLAGHRVGDLRFRAGFDESDDVRVLADLLQHIQIVLVNRDCVRVRAVAHALECETTLAVKDGRHGSPADLLQYYVVLASCLLASLALAEFQLDCAGAGRAEIEIDWPRELQHIRCLGHLLFNYFV